MKSLTLVFAILVAGICQAQVKLSLTVNGQPVGTATFKQGLKASGSLEQTVTMALKGPTGTANFAYLSTSDKAGRTIKETNTQTMGATSKTVVVEFGSKTVKVTTIQNGKSTSKSVPIPAGNRADASTFWFVNVKPKAGATSTYMHFDVDTGSWKKETTKYVGDDVVPGTKLKGHHIHHDDGDMWLDDKGTPLRIETSQNGIQMVFVRQ
ncbi:MAG TPA: hypothetical protein VHE55_03045 [Fimbriimonadaceae bacterium]|nr:hypothetical protein [Fimbriimonadaceae bacterium]